MNFTKYLILVFSVLFIFGCTTDSVQIQLPITNTEINDLNKEENELFNLLQKKDSLLFDIGFNQIDTLQIIELTSDDFEFYHDEHGITDSKSAFVKSIQGIEDLPFKTWRVLVKGSLSVHPLFKNNSQELYGAIQNGQHDFYQQNEGETERKTNTAKFTHLWIIEDEEWKLKRVLSFDHQVPTEN